MHKKLLTVICSLLCFSTGFAQVCVPDGQYTDPGIYPDSTTGLPDAPAGGTYATTITLVVPTDTNIYQPGIGMIALTLNYMTIDSITGLPQGLSYSCEPSNCQIPGGNSGCILISGQAAVPNYYDLTIYVTSNVTHPLLGTFNAPQAAYSSHITVANTGSNLPIADFNVANVAQTGQTVALSNNSQYASSYNWSFPGGNPGSSTLANPTTAYNTAGTYTITLTATNVNGNDTHQETIVVSDNPVLPDSTGFYPDCQTGLDHGVLGALYNDTLFTGYIPPDSTMDVPSLGIIHLDINYLQIDSVIGLPPGISYSCSPPDCRVDSASSGFVVFSGQPLAQGVYPFKLYYYMNVYHALLGTFNFGDSLECELIIGQDNSLVWPGDANSDGVADNYDLLPIGQYFGQTGTARGQQDINWTGHTASTWTQVQSNGANLKHADCNGDGTVNNADTLAISANFASTHNKTFDIVTSSSGPDLYFEFNQPDYNEGEEIIASIYLGTSATPADNSYGLAVDISYNAAVVQASSASFHFTPSFFGADAIALGKAIDGDGLAKFAVTKTNHSNVSGYGKIGELHFIAHEGSGEWALQLSVVGYQFNDANGNETLLNPVSSSIAVGINELTPAGFNLYPNPSAGSFNIELTLEKNNSLQGNIRNLLGQNVYSFHENAGKGLYKKNIEPALSQGIYYFTLQTNEGIVTKKIEIVK